MTALNFKWTRWRRLFRASVLASAMMGTLIVGGAVSTWYVYQRIENYHGWNPTLIKVRKHVRNLADQPRVALERNMGLSGDPGSSSPLPAFYLQINSKNLEAFMAALPTHKNTKLSEEAREHWKASITPVGFEGISEQEISVKFRCRGNGSAHWYWPKKSWRIRFPKDQLFRGIRKLNIINPESMTMLNDAIANWFARRVGLFTPPFDFCKLYVNGQYHGVMLLAEQPDEYFLQRHDQAIGNVYAETDALNRELFTNIHAWRKLCVGKNSTEDDFSDLNALLAVLNHPDDAVFEQHIEGLLDIDAFLRWHAVNEFFVSYHQDALHNNRLYNDPTDGRFRFFAWDVQAFYPYDFTPAITHPLVLRILQNPRFKERYDATLADIVFDEGLEKECVDELERMIELTYEDALADRNKGYSFSAFERVSYSNARYEEELQALRNRIPARFREIRAKFEQPGEVYASWVGGDSSAPRIDCWGPSSWRYRLTDLQLTGAEAIADGATCRWVWDANHNFRVDATDPTALSATWSASKETWEVEAEAVWVAPSSSRPGGPAVNDRATESFLLAEGTLGEVSGVQLRLERRVGSYSSETSVPVKLIDSSWTATLPQPMAHAAAGASPNVTLPQPVGVAAADPEFEAQFPWIKEWGPGEVHLDSLLHVPARCQLTLVPGTRLIMGEDASLLIEGTLQAVGTVEEPIHIGGLDGAPWGVVAILGASASASRLQHVTLDGGGERRLKGVLFTGMLAIHKSDVPVQECTFRNARGDDALNCKYWNSTLVDCQFEDNGFDSIDIDFSSGVIRDCVILRSGNDGLDLGTAHTRIWNLEVRGCGDKGVSIGERSRPQLFNCLLVENQVGIASKDQSEPAIVHCTIVNNKVGIAAYRKKEQYGGGRGEIVNSIVLGNDVEWQFDQYSEVAARYSMVSGDHPGVGNVVGDLSALTAASFTLVADAAEAAQHGGDVQVTRSFLSWSEEEVPMGRLAAAAVAHEKSENRERR